MLVKPWSSCRREHSALAASKSAPCRTTLPPSRETFECLIAGVPIGIVIVAGIRSLRDEYATPWAWFPEQTQCHVCNFIFISKSKSRLTCRTCHYTFPFLGLTQMRHLVVGTPELERENGLEVLTLEAYIAFKSIAQVDGMC